MRAVLLIAVAWLALALPGCAGCDLDERWWLEARQLDGPRSPAIDLDQERDIPAELAAVLGGSGARPGTSQLEVSEERSDVIGRWLATRWQDLPGADERATAYVVERGDAWSEVWLSGSHNDC